MQLTLREKCPYSEFFWTVFSRIWTEYGGIRRENSDQKNSEYGHFLRNVVSNHLHERSWLKSKVSEHMWTQL